MARLLVVEDDETIGSVLAASLERHGFTVRWERTGHGGRYAALAEDFDLVLLDLGLPDADGIEVCRELRAQQPLTVLVILTARQEEMDVVLGLEAGADDYVVKPFALEELFARVRALLRRGAAGDAGEVLRFADLELNQATREVRRGGDSIELTRTEFSLLELFLLNPRQVLTRSVIFERVWGYDFGFASNSLDVYIGYLRRKTEAGGKPRLIQTVRGVGYALREA